MHSFTSPLNVLSFHFPWLLRVFVKSYLQSKSYCHFFTRATVTFQQLTADKALEMLWKFVRKISDFTLEQQNLQRVELLILIFKEEAPFKKFFQVLW